MERTEWLKKMRTVAEGLYDQVAPGYWLKYGYYANETHRQFLEQFLARLKPGSVVLDAACGAGRYDGFLAEAGQQVVGIDQSARMLARAREHFSEDRYPELHYIKMGLQEMEFAAQFDGAICMDAMEHIPPEDWPGIVDRFARALKPGGMLYMTVETVEPDEIRAAYERGRAKGLPVVWGEMADEVEAAWAEIEGLAWEEVPGERSAAAAYHYYPEMEQVRAWIREAGMVVEEEGEGDGYQHLLVRKGGKVRRVPIP